MIWKVLGIEKTKDKELIRKAYLTKLHSVNPEDDQEGFKELRNAYEEALLYSDEPDKQENDKDVEEPNEKKNEVDLWIDKISVVYEDIADRRNPGKWNSLFRDPVCDDLDTEIEAGEKLLIYLMSHSYIPQSIWKLIDNRFDYSHNVSALKERFPENYIDYIIWQINNPGFLDYDLFDGKTDDRADEFINKLYEIKNAEENKDIDKATKIIEELRDFEITHPYLDVEEANCLLIKAGKLSELCLDEKEENENSDEDRKKALDIMEEIDFEYSSNIYIHRIYGETLLANKKIDKAFSVFDELSQLENITTNFSVLLGKAKCMILQGDYENAKEQLEDILEEKVQDFEALSLLDVVNNALVKEYQKQLNNTDNIEPVIKLGWCYYQQREFNKGIKLLDEIADNEEYDYINLRCRLYLANDEYEKAYPLAKKWLDMIETSVDDGSREMAKRKNRLSLAHFSIGICLWQINENRRDEAVIYIEKSISEENNRLVKLSYMEQLAKFYLADKIYEKCVDKCTEIIEIDRGFFPAYVHRQRANYELKNAKEVVDDYYACVELYAEYAPPYVLAAEVFFAFEQYDDIEEILKKASEANIESDALDLYKIRVLHYKDFNKKNLEKCLALIDALEQRMKNRTDDNPTDIEKVEDVVREHTLIYWDLDENDKALKLLNDFTENNKDCFSIQNLKIDILNQSGKSKEALKLCQKLYEDNQTAYMQTRLGICYEKVEDYDNALSAYKEAYDKDPEYHIVVRRLMYLYSYLSNSENDLDKCRTGIKYATEYIKLTDAPEGYMERGNLYIDIYELDKAVDDCKKAIELDENLYYAYNNLGCALLKLRRIDEAIPILKHAIKMDEKKDHLPFLNLAECYIVRHEYEKAIDTYKRMMKVFHNLNHYMEDVGKLYCKLKDYKKAIACYEHIIDEINKKLKPYTFLDRMRKDTTNASDYVRILEMTCEIAEVYRQSGDIDRANEYYKKVIGWWKKKMRPDVSVKSLIRVAEFYRDQGNINEAVKMIRYVWKKMTPEEIHTRVRRNYDFAAMTIYFEMGDKKNAIIKSKIYMEEVTKSLGSIDKLLSDARYRSMWLYNIGIAKLCAGEIRDAVSYFEQIRECKLCVMCENEDCFEYYFAMGLVAEIEQKYEKAQQFYVKAIELRGDYPCAGRHLEMVKNKANFMKQ